MALDSVDEAIGRLMEGLYHKDLHNCANIIIVADHGKTKNEISKTYFIVLRFCFVFLRLVYSMLPVSLDCPFLIAPLVFSNIYLLLF